MFPDIAPVTVCVGIKLTYSAHTAEVICLRSRTRISSEKPL